MTPDYKAGFEAAREAAAHMVALKGKTRASPFLPLSRRIRALQPEPGSTAPAVEMDADTAKGWWHRAKEAEAEVARLKASQNRAWTSEQAMSTRVTDAEAEVERWKASYEQQAKDFAERRARGEEALKLRYNQLIAAEARAREAEARLAELETAARDLVAFWANTEARSSDAHAVYQTEAHRRGDVRHPDAYADLSEPTKEWDRVLVRWVQSTLLGET